MVVGFELVECSGAELPNKVGFHWYLPWVYVVSRLFLLLASASELDASRGGACSSDPVIRDHILDLSNRCNSAVAHLGLRWVSASHGPVHCSVSNGLPCRRDRAPRQFRWVRGLVQEASLPASATFLGQSGSGHHGASSRNRQPVLSQKGEPCLGLRNRPGVTRLWDASL